jgi:hypothetical protein
LGFFGDGEGAVVDCGEIEIVEDAGYVVFFGKCFFRWDFRGGREVFLVLGVEMLVRGPGRRLEEACLFRETASEEGESIGLLAVFLILLSFALILFVVMLVICERCCNSCIYVLFFFLFSRLGSLSILVSIMHYHLRLIHRRSGSGGGVPSAETTRSRKCSSSSLMRGDWVCSRALFSVWCFLAFL